jgi:hypothetical protein
VPVGQNMLNNLKMQKDLFKKAIVDGFKKGVSFYNRTVGYKLWTEDVDCMEKKNAFQWSVSNLGI